MDSSRLPSSPPQSASMDDTRSSSPAPDATPGGGGLQPSPLFKANMSIVPSSGGLFSPDKHHDSLRSDAIGGPEDFTIHLVDYMTGQKAMDLPARVPARSIMSGTPAMARESSVRRSPLKDLDSPNSPSSLPRSISGSGRLGRTRLASSSSPPRERAAPGAVAFMRSHIERLEEDLAAERGAREADRTAHMIEIERITSAHREELEAALKELRSVKDAREAELKNVAAQYTQQVKTAFEQERTRHQEELERIKAEHNRSLKDAAEEINELKERPEPSAEGTPDSEEERRQAVDELRRVKEITKEHLRAAQDEIDQLQAEVDGQKLAKDELEEAKERILELEAQVAYSLPSATRTKKLQDELLELRLQLGTRDERISELQSEMRASRQQPQPAAPTTPPKEQDTTGLAAQLALRTEDFNRATARAQDLERLNARYAKQMQAANHRADTVEAAHAAELQRIVANHERVRSEEREAMQQQLNVSQRNSKTATFETARLTAQLAEQAHRVGELEKLNRELGKQLMRAWGREEFGDTGEKQKYRYKYVKA